MKLTKKILTDDLQFRLVDGFYNKGAFYLLPDGDNAGFTIYVAMSEETRKVKWENVYTVGKLQLLFNDFHVFPNDD